MHSIIRHGQFHGQLHGQVHRQVNGPLEGQSASGTNRPFSAAQPPGASEWQRRGLTPVSSGAAPAGMSTGMTAAGAPTGRIDVCRLLVAMLGLTLYLALPIAAIGFALVTLFR